MASCLGRRLVTVVRTRIAARSVTTEQPAERVVEIDTMMISYNTVFSKKRESKFDTSPDLVVGVSGGSALLTLDTYDFDIKYKDGVASVLLGKHLSVTDLRELSAALTRAADELDNVKQQWLPNNVRAGVGTMPAGMSLVQEVKPNDG